MTISSGLKPSNFFGFSSSALLGDHHHSGKQLKVVGFHPLKNKIMLLTPFYVLETISSLLISILLHLRQCFYIQQYNLAPGKVKTKRKEQDQFNEEAAKEVVSGLEHQEETMPMVR